MSKPLAVQKRLYPGEVVRAYKRKGIKAVFRSWSKRIYNYKGEVEANCGCAMTARFCTAKEIETIPPTQIDNLVTQRAKDYGLSQSYLSNFVFGFDGSAKDVAGTNEIEQGYADGERCRKLVLKHGLVIFD
jgi:hypothetical protein